MPATFYYCLAVALPASYFVGSYLGTKAACYTMWYGGQGQVPIKVYKVRYTGWVCKGSEVVTVPGKTADSGCYFCITYCFL